MISAIPAPRTRPRRRSRFVLAGIAAFALATPAFAAIDPWGGAAGGPSGASSPDPAAGLNALGVLDRKQTDTDLAFAPLLSKGANAQLEAPDLASLRAVASGWAVIPAKLSDPVHGTQQQICLTSATLVGCSGAGSFPSTGLQITIGTKGGTTRLVGLVPDGVASVRIVPTDGDDVTAPVKDNYYSVELGSHGPTPEANSPVDGSPTPAPVTPAGGKTEWLDASGAVIGPKA